ncbi:phosphatidylinositol-3,5-bisphosphate 5-phosphatase [Tilletia horrida]|nr:phosphatidylinositol-3,5-bisphosphate 5-phosphatase [Tilletia horrida]
MVSGNSGLPANTQARVGGPKRFVLWETKTRFYLVAFNVSQTKFRILKVDRTGHIPTSSPDPASAGGGSGGVSGSTFSGWSEASRSAASESGFTNATSATGGTGGPNAASATAQGKRRSQPEWELNVTADRTVYTRAQVIDLLSMIREGNKSSGGLKEVGRFFGIVGFIRFTSTYYMVLISRRSVVALLGGHYIYHCDETRVIPVCHSSVLASLPGRSKALEAEEARLLATFRQVDLSKNFYFSYSLDLTRTLQDNLTALPEQVAPSLGSDSQSNLASDSAWGYNEKFVWNHHLLLPAFKDTINLPADSDGNEWVLPLVYGFVDQAKLSILNRTVYVTLIARRSRHFAGARFLKRGVDARGHVANDVETEQIVNEALTTPFYAPRRKRPGSKSGAASSRASSKDRAADKATSTSPEEKVVSDQANDSLFENNHEDEDEDDSDERLRFEPSPRFTSYVMYRGSIPIYWTQDSTNMSPRPPIEISVVDPYYSAAALHFDDLFRRYGTPVIVLNLVKSKEKVPREMKLLHHFKECTAYLNQFLPEDKQIRHIAWDMSRASKSHDQDVIGVLEDIAEETISSTQFFHSGPELTSRVDDNANTLPKRETILLQNGVARVCCVDCLDRTNAAQFVIGKAAFGHQLHALGLLHHPSMPFDSEAVNMLTEMYHDLGDTVALQYGGSHLVNTMETYRKINQWSSHSRDMLEGLKRYYANSFADADKQAAINLFLGVTDFDSAHDYGPGPTASGSNQRRHYQQWFTPQYLQKRGTLEERTKRLEEVVNNDADFWAEYYRPGLFTDLERHHAYKMTAVPQQEPANKEKLADWSVFSAPEHSISHQRRPSASSKLLGRTTPQKRDRNASRTDRETSAAPVLSAQALALTKVINKNMQPDVSSDELREYGWYTRQFRDAQSHMQTGLETTSTGAGLSSATPATGRSSTGPGGAASAGIGGGAGAGAGRSKFRHIADEDVTLYANHVAVAAGDFSKLSTPGRDSSMSTYIGSVEIGRGNASSAVSGVGGARKSSGPGGTGNGGRSAGRVSSGPASSAALSLLTPALPSATAAARSTRPRSATSSMPAPSKTPATMTAMG